MDIVTLIPAYKPQYLAELLNSLRLQTRPSRQILIADDSPGGEFRAALYSDAMAPLRAGLDIECHEGPRRGGYANMMHLVRLWDGRSDLLRSNSRNGPDCPFFSDLPDTVGNVHGRFLW
jgi:hypothetical protein